MGQKNKGALGVFLAAWHYKGMWVSKIREVISGGLRENEDAVQIQHSSDDLVIILACLIPSEAVFHGNPRRGELGCFYIHRLIDTLQQTCALSISPQERACPLSMQWKAPQSSDRQPPSGSGCIMFHSAKVMMGSRGWRLFRKTVAGSQ